MRKPLRFSLGFLLVIVAVVAAYLGGRYQRDLQQPNYTLQRAGRVSSIRGDFSIEARYSVEVSTQTKIIRERGVTLIEIHPTHILLEFGRGTGKVLGRDGLIRFDWQPSTRLQQTADIDAVETDADVGTAGR